MPHMSMKNKVGRFFTTESKSFDCCITWTIENFLLRSQDWEENARLDSPNFTSETLSAVKWKASVGIHRVKADKDTEKDTVENATVEEEKYVSVNYHLLGSLPDNVESVSAEYSCSILDALKNKVHSRQEFEIFEPKTKGWEKFINLAELNSNPETYLLDGHFTLECRIKAYVNFKSSTFSATPTVPFYPSWSFDTLSNIHDDAIHSDITLKTKGREFKCHKSVLSARSLYFQNLFKNNLNTSSNNIFDYTITFGTKGMEDFLRFIYTGEVTNPEANYRKLWLEAEKHGILDLMETSEMELIKKVRPDTAVDLLDFAMKNGALRLLKAAATCISKS